MRPYQAASLADRPRIINPNAQIWLDSFNKYILLDRIRRWIEADMMIAQLHNNGVSRRGTQQHPVNFIITFLLYS